MKKHLKCLLPVIMLTMTTGCSSTTYHYEDVLDEYVFEMEYHDNFNILQLTDIHWNINTSTTSSKSYISNLLAEVDSHIQKEQGESAKIDLVELTGDTFMLATADYVDSFIEFFEEQADLYGFTYTVIWGNHDRQGTYNPAYLAKSFANAEHCLYKEVSDDLYGRSNFVINLMSGDTTVWQIANLDSGASFSDSFSSFGRDYDYIRDDEVDWWTKVHAAAGDNVPSIAYFHIPTTDFDKIYEQVSSSKAAGETTYKDAYFKLEGFGSSEVDSTFIETAKANNLKGAFCGHAHNVDWTVEYDDLIMGLGVKTGTELYYAEIDVDSTDAAVQAGLASTGITEDFDLIGASLVTITDESNFTLDHVYYNERTGDDFVAWVRF